MCFKSILGDNKILLQIAPLSAMLNNNSIWFYLTAHLHRTSIYLCIDSKGTHPLKMAKTAYVFNNINRMKTINTQIRNNPLSWMVRWRRQNHELATCSKMHIKWAATQSYARIIWSELDSPLLSRRNNPPLPLLHVSRNILFFSHVTLLNWYVEIPDIP